MQIFGVNQFLVFLVLAFVTVLLLLEGLYLLWLGWRGPEAMRMKRRLGTFTTAATPLSVLRQRLGRDDSTLGRVLDKVPGRNGLEHMVMQSGLEWPVSGVIVGCIALGLFAFAGLLDVHFLTTWMVLLLAVAIGLLPIGYVAMQRNRRMARLGRQLPDALDLITRALRAGHAFTAGLKMAGDEMPQPIAGELKAVHEEISFGVSLQQALTHLCERVPLTDVRYFTVAVLIQRESGGNLTEILTDLSALIRQRAKLIARVRVLSSEGRLSAWILGLMPFALGGVMTLLNYDFMSLLWTDPIGVTLIRVMLALMVMGAFLLAKISKIRV
ncbi:type II secretion system F family protein [Ramlibacter sp. AW1]|uniref:Type II secretion system F family protein n=1 Tax=Ramlibacter aurantiacus TaxID=2801330 RepID=A0A936ZS29_9BURK|nr:type II secretion system F family protein [Ramlibacter aurantiacus]MBL0419594.1 type II secretion system F family protein [Ramlibacter aurantiacus]